MYFDASDVGLPSSDLAEFQVRLDGSVLMSYSSDGFTVPAMTGGPDGVLVDDSDIFLFTPTSLGDNTAGSFSFYFDGSDVDLTGYGEDIDGLFEFNDGSLGISTNGTITVGALTGGDEDVHRFTGSFGADTTGTWSEYFDASSVGLSSPEDDLNAISFDTNGDLLFSPPGTNTHPGSDDEDINRYTGTYNPTAGTITLELDLSLLGIPATASVDALHSG